MTPARLEIGLDIGAVAVKAVAVDPAGAIVAAAHQAIAGRLQPCLAGVLEELGRAAGADRCNVVGVTGSRADGYARVLGVPLIGSIVALGLAGQRLVPSAGGLLELGGEHAAFLRLGPVGGDGTRPVLDCATNTACSAGTGAFLEQEAHRFGVSTEQFAAMAARAARAARVAGRCAVFAKTDVVHKHQNGVPLDELALGLCVAIATGVASELTAGRPFQRPLAFVGGVAANQGMRRALLAALTLAEEDLVIPEQYRMAGALGAVMGARSRPDLARPSLTRSLSLLAGRPAPSLRRALPQLIAPPPPAVERAAAPRPSPSDQDGGVIGIDIGSTSTNLAFLDAGGAVLDLRSLPTRGDPLAAAVGVLRGLEESRGPLAPSAVGVTGSGRRFIAELIGADFAVNEITAHAAGCAKFYPDADTIFDIGGQDAKFIRLDGGEVVEFEMNKACSAGTGSFLEEMAALLGLDIVGEFGREALRARSPVDLGERCTVFMGSEVARCLQEGCAREDLTAGLAYSVVRNYLARVVGRHAVGRRVVVQGGVAANQAVVAALRQVLGRDVTVHRYHDTAGAIGVALLAAEKVRAPSKFRGLSALGFGNLRTRSFNCPRCANQCTVHVTTAPDRRRFFAGGLCDRYEGSGQVTRAAGRPDLFAEREAALDRWVAEASPGSAGVVGIPRGLFFHEQLPFWTAFLGALDVPYVLSPPTGPHTLERAAALSPPGTCLPLRLAYGHAAELVRAGVRRLLIPSVASLSDRTVAERLDHACPSVQGWPYTARALMAHDVEILAPRLRLSIPRLVEPDLREAARLLGAAPRNVPRAIAAGRQAQADFTDAMLRRGDEVLADRDGRQTVAVLARPYAVCDPAVNLRLKRVLEDVGLLAVPMDMIRDEPLSSRALQGMYWYSGKRLLQAARAVRRLGRLPAVCISCFGCGPDAFILHLLRRELGSVPALELEVDEHSELNGIHTRVEAFSCSLGARRAGAPEGAPPPERAQAGDLHGRRLYIPRMSDHAAAFAGAFRSCGVDAEVLPLPDEESIGLGRRTLNGGECLPCACVLGDMLRCVEGRNPAGPAPAFFMISGDGPCRLGQYPWVQRAILDQRGHADVPIFNASQDPEFYQHFGALPAVFQRRAWEGTAAIDLLFRKWRETRVRAASRDDADALYRELLAGLEQAIERGTALIPTLRAGFDRMEALARSDVAPSVTIGLLGENYVRCNAAANAGVAEALEDLGAEVWYPSLCEWVSYTNWTARLHCRYERQHRRLAQLLLIDGYQRLSMSRMTRAVRGRLASAGYPSVRELLRLAAPYVPRTFEGETIVGIGRTVDLQRRGVGGVIHVSPFGCMVGGIVETVSRRLSEDLGGFPILNLHYDGRPGERAGGLLESFVLRARSWQEGRRDAAARPH